MMFGLFSQAVLICAAVQANACSAEIKFWRGFPSIWVNGEPQFPIAFLMHTGDFDKEYSQMAQIGIRFFTMAAPIGATPDGFSPEGCDDPFWAILKHRPDALIFPRVDVSAPSWWLDAHPNDRVVFDDGTKGPQSMFSEAWLKDACSWIELYSHYIRTGSYAPNVLGIHICSGYTGEWQSWGLWDNLRGDFSPVALDAWHRYLRKKYKTSATLSRSWGKKVSLRDAPMPSRQRRESDGYGLLRPLPEFQDVVDFYDFYWRGTAHAISQLAAAAKRGGGKDWLVGFFYGYGIQYGGKTQESQHLGISRILNDRNIDFFCSPAMYTQRQVGGTSTFMSYTDSIRMRNKFWWHEADNRTHLSRNDPVFPAKDLFETLNVLKREFAHVWTRHVGIWWFDMQGGWYDAPEIRSMFREMVDFSRLAPEPWEPEIQVAVFVDDKSTYRMRPEESFLDRNITNLMAEMPKLGAPYHTYLLEDIVRCPKYDLYLFVNAFDLTEDEYAAIRAIQKQRATLIFLGPADVCQIVRKYPAIRFLNRSKPIRVSSKQVTPVAEHARTFFFEDGFQDIRELRQIASDAGVFLFHDQSDALYVGNGLIAIHGAPDTLPAKRLQFPAEVQLEEILSNNPSKMRGIEINVQVRHGETRCFKVRPTFSS